MDKPVQRTSVKPSSSIYVIALSCVAAIGGFLFGFDSGVINGAVDALAKAFGTKRQVPALLWLRCCSAAPLAPLAQALSLTRSGGAPVCS